MALTEALIADPRNDDHAIISQLTALFATLHNGLIDIIAARKQHMRGRTRTSAPPTSASCVPARALTAIYHHVIHNDLMRRVIHPAIYAAYSGTNPDFIDRPAFGGRLPTGTGKFRSSSRTAHFVSVTPWCGPNIGSTTCRSTTSAIRSKRAPSTTPPTCRSTRPGWCNGRAFSRSTGRRRTLAAASGRISATGSAMTRSFRRSTKPNGSACSIATCSARRWPACGRSTR